MSNPNEVMDEVRRKIGVHTEAVFMHSIALGHGKTHEEAADAIYELFAQQNAALLKSLIDQSIVVKNGEHSIDAVKKSILEAKLNEITKEVKI